MRPQPPPSLIQLRRRALGITLIEEAPHVRSSPAVLSRLERGDILRPELEQRIHRFLTAQERLAQLRAQPRRVRRRRRQVA